MRITFISLFLTAIGLWCSCTPKSDQPAIIQLSPKDQQLKDSLWEQYYAHRYSDQQLVMSILRACRSLESKYDPIIGQVSYYANMVHFFSEVGMLDSARVYTDSQFRLLRSGQVKAGNLVAQAYATKGSYFAGREQWDSAIKNDMYALELLRTSPDRKTMLNVSDALSLIYLQQNNFEMAIQYYLPYIEDIKQSGNPARNFDIMINLYAMTDASGNDSLKQAGRNYLFSAKRIADSVQLDNAHPALEYMLATYYFGIHKDDSGLYYTNKAIALLKARPQIDNQMQMVYGQLVQYYLSAKNYPAAQQAYKEMQQNVDTTQFSKREKSEYLGYAFELESHLGTPASALSTLIRLKAVDDSISKDMRNDKLLKYEAHMKQLAHDNLINARAYEAKNQRYYMVFITIIAMLTFSASIYAFYYWKKKRLMENMYWNQLQKQKDVEHRNQLLEERSRISREMHDDLGTTLTSTLMAVEMIEMFPGQKEPMDMVRNTANNLHQQVNEIIWNLNTQNDNIRSLNNYMIRFAKQFLEQAHISLRLDESVEDETVTVPSFQRRMIYLSFKELINNIVKHAQATEVILSIRTGGNHYHMTIEDNGVGMEARKTNAAAPYGSSGYGLDNISRNIERLFGKVYWQPASPVGGTRVDIDMSILAA